MAKKLSYNTLSSWEERYKESASLAASGTYTHTEIGNKFFYKTKFAAVDRCLHLANKHLTEAAVLDIAGGTGQFVPYYLNRGARRVTVADFSPTALSTVRTRFQNESRVDTLPYDLQNPLDVSDTYDIVSIFEAIFLLKNDKDLSTALHKLFPTLRPDGVLLISDLFPTAKIRENEYVVRRSRSSFEDTIRASGLSICGYISQSWAFNRHILGKYQRRFETIGGALVLYLIDRLILNIYKYSLSDGVKYLVAKKNT